jgi:hypothetical protein
MSLGPDIAESVFHCNFVAHDYGNCEKLGKQRDLFSMVVARGIHRALTNIEVSKVCVEDLWLYSRQLISRFLEQS